MSIQMYLSSVTHSHEWLSWVTCKSMSALRKSYLSTLPIKWEFFLSGTCRLTSSCNCLPYVTSQCFLHLQSNCRETSLVWFYPQSTVYQHLLGHLEGLVQIVGEGISVTITGWSCDIPKIVITPFTPFTPLPHHSLRALFATFEPPPQRCASLVFCFCCCEDPDLHPEGKEKEEGQIR